MSIKRPTRKKMLAIIVLIIIALLMIIISIFLSTKYQNGKFNLGSSIEVGSVEENEDLMIKVGKLIKLPVETPEIATVTDVDQLQDQTIFKNAQNGDKVLIFTQAKRAIVYRPSENIIVEVGNLVIPEGSASATLNQESEEEEVTVTVFNATSTAGYAGRIGDELESKFSNIRITDTANAAGDYETTLVIDLSGGNDEIVNAIAQNLGGETGQMPSDEEEPDSDILIILGQ